MFDLNQLLTRFISRIINSEQVLMQSTILSGSNKTPAFIWILFALHCPSLRVMDATLMWAVVHMFHIKIKQGPSCLNLI